MNINGVEISLIVVIVLIQLTIFWRTKRQITRLEQTFPETDSLGFLRLYIPRTVMREQAPPAIIENQYAYTTPLLDTESPVNTSIVQCAILRTEEDTNDVFDRIQLAINTYLIRTAHGSPDFALIKDIVERNTDALEEDINLTISVPLYLGLMGTMLGIVIGLFSMSDLSLTFTGSGREDQLGQGISVLLGGVKIAMIASFVGLFLTVINNGWFYKRAKGEAEALKNEFYTFIQTELLPVVGENLGSTFETLQKNLSRFNENFTGNVDKLSGVFTANVEALKLQEKILSTIENIDIATIAKYNVSVIKEIRTSAKEFERFNDHFSNVNSFVESSNTLAGRLTDILERTDNVKTIAAGVEDRLEQSKKLLDFLSKHIEDLEGYKKVTSDSIADTGFAITETFRELQTHIQLSTKSLEEFTVQEVDLLRTALSASRTNLSNLEYLETLKDDVSLFKDSTASQGERLRGSLESLNKHVEMSVSTLRLIERKLSAGGFSKLTAAIRNLFKNE